MSTTTYTQLDLINEIIVDNTLVNCVNLATLPNVNYQGLIDENPFTLLTSQIRVSISTEGSASVIYDVDHSSPIPVIPTNAQIRTVDVRMLTSGDPSATADTSMTFGGGHRQGLIQAGCTINRVLTPLAIDGSLGTNNNSTNTDAHDSGYAGGLLTTSANLSLAGKIIGYSFDFTTNPGGLFPLGYMTYADFITNFATMIFNFRVISSGGAQWEFFPPDAPDVVGTFVGGCNLTANTFAMEVTWEVPLSWTINTPTITLPDNILDISRPSAPDPDTEFIEAIIIEKSDGTKKRITPDDPWVTLWVRLRIIIHFPPDEIDDPDDDPVDIKVEIRGTEFSGEVELGTVTIISADLSGIYKLDETTHKDTLYDRSGTGSPTTVAVAIPSPMLCTAYIANEDSEILHYTGIRMRVTGQGNLKSVMQSYDYLNTELLTDLVLYTSGNVSPFVLSNFIDQAGSLRLYMDTLDDFMNVSKLVIYSKSIFTGYPQ